MKPILISVLCIALSACMMSPERPMTRRLDAETLALSCKDLAARQGRIEARVKELEEESQQKARGRAVTDTVINVGLASIIGVGARGGVGGLRTASAAVQGIETVRAIERGNGNYQDVTDVVALATRSGELQAAMVEKGC